MLASSRFRTVTRLVVATLIAPFLFISISAPSAKAARLGTAYDSSWYVFGGGNYNGPSACAADNVVVGITYNQNPMVNGYKCAPLNADLTVSPLSATLRATANYVFCPDGMAAVGYQAINSSGIHIGLKCKTLPLLNDAGAETDLIATQASPKLITHTTQTLTASMLCNSGDVMIGQDTYSNLWFDQLAARCAPLVKFTLAYNVNGGTGTAPATQTQTSPISDLTVESNYAGTKTGYHFTGWNTLANGTGTNYAQGYTYTPTGNLTLYAQWNSTITYDDNNSDAGTAPNPTTAVGIAATTTLATNSGSLTRTGFTFTGWNTAADGSGTNYAAGLATYSSPGDITLYAQWNSTITYSGNTNTSVVSTVPAVYTSKGSAPFNLANPTTLLKTGYTLSGWNTAADGSGSNYALGASYVSSGNITLYAKWTATVTFNINTATSGTASQATISALPSASINLATVGTMVKSGYTFTSWNTAANGSGTSYVPGSSYTPTGNITLYAIWTLNCSPTTSTGGGNQVIKFPAGAACAYTVPAGVTSIDLLVVGGGGGGGSNVGNGGGGGGLTAATNVSVTPGQVLSLTVGAGGAPATAGSASTITVGATTYSATGGAGGATWGNGAANCTTPGKTAGGTGTTANGAKGGAGPTAQYGVMCNGLLGTTNSISGKAVIYGSGGGGGGYNSPFSGTHIGLGGTGVLFNGAGNGGNYIAAAVAGSAGIDGQGGGGGGGSAGSASGGAGGAGTIIIAFDKALTVTFDVNGGSGTNSTVTQSAPDAAITTAAGTTRSGFTFAGWNTAADGSGTDIAASTSYTPTSSLTLYAKWTYTLTYDGNTNTAGTAPNSETITGATEDVLLSRNVGSLAKTNSTLNYTFSGWNTSATGSGTLFGVNPPMLPAPYLQYNANSWDSVNRIMLDQSGNGRNSTFIRGTPTVVSVSAANGTSKTINVLNGTTAAGFVLPNPQIANYTLCFVARYSGATKSRIFDGTNLNWLTGFFVGNTGVAYHNGWITPSTGVADSNFHVICDFGNNLVSDGVAKNNGTTTITYLPANISVNNGLSSSEFSDWQLADLVLYNSTLTAAEVLQVEMFLKEKYGITTSTAAIPTYAASGSALNSYYTSAAGNSTVYAQWNSLVTYDANGASSGTVPYPTNYVNSIAGTLATNSGTLVKTKFTFGGWNTKADGSGTNYAAGAAYTGQGNLTLYAQWNLVITYDANFGSTPNSGAAPTATSQSSTSAFNLPGVGTMVKTGYTFLGWATTASATIAAYAAGASYTPTGSATLYAVWSANALAITFDPNGGSGTMAALSYTAGTAKALSANAFTRTGYTFAGWTTVADGTGTSYTNSQSITIYTSFTIYAKWTANTYSITFNANSGTGTMAAQSFTAGTAFNINTNLYTRTGYTFNGWNTVAVGTGTSYTNSQSVTLYAAVTLYAQWVAQVYVVTYSNNGGSGSASVTSQNYTYGSAAITSFATVGTMTKTGYTFGGWSATASGTTALTTLSPTGTTTLYAIWTAKSFNIVFDGNTSTSGTMSNLAMVSGTAKTLTTNVFAKTGYSFGSWNTAANGSGTTYANGASVTLVSDSATVTFYAQWTILAPAAPTISATASNTTATVSITSSAVGTASAGSVSSYTVTALDASGNPLPGPITCTITPPATSCTFTGLTNGTSYKFSVVANNATGSSSATVLGTAVTPTPYVISYDANSGTVSPTSANFNLGTPVVLPLPTRSGYSFNGWFTAATGGMLIGPNGTSYSPTGNITLYAQWSGISYAITYNSNGGSTTVPSNGAYVTGGSAYAIADAPAGMTKTGYTFNGWNTAADGTGTNYAAADTYNTSADLNLFAKWSAISYTVNYENGGGTGTLPTETNKTIGQTFTVASGATLTKSGYSFTGWTDSTNTYFNGSTYTVGAGNVTLTAVWSALQYVVTYDANGGTGTVPTEPTHASGETLTVKAATGITRVGYSFTGWAVGATVYSVGQTFTMPTANVTFAAQWTPLVYTITYSPNTGATGDASRTSDSFTYGGSAISLPTVGTMTKAGYVFNGWAETSTVISGLYTPTQTITLFAQWAPGTYTITWNTNGAGGTIADTSFTTGGTLTQPAPTRTGYTLSGWSTTPTGSVISGSYSPTSNTTLYAIWTPANQTLNFNAGTVDGGISSGLTLATTSVTRPFGTNYTLQNIDSATVTVGSQVYAFTGWKSTSGTIYASGSTYVVEDGGTTFTAQWIKRFVVTYVLNGGTFAGSDAATDNECANAGNMCNDLQNITTNATPTRAGYNFVNWKDQSAETVNAASVYQVRDNHYVLSAQWTPATITATYVGDGGTLITTTQSGAYLSNITLADAITKTGYTFAGWSDGTNTYGAGASYQITSTSGFNLTAQWVSNNYSVSYDLNQGTSATAIASATHAYNAPITVTSTVPTRTGYNFVNWLDVAAPYGTGAAYTMPARNVVFIAQWSAATFNVTYNLGTGGNGSLPTQGNTAFGSTFTLATTPTNSDSTVNFLGWSDGTNVMAAGSTYTMPAHDVTLTAQWSAALIGVSYSITGATSGTAPATQLVAPSTTVTTAPSTGIVRTRYSLTAWSTGTTSVAPQSTITPTTNTTLSAVWVPATPDTPTETLAAGNGSVTITVGQGSGTGGVPTSYVVTASNGSTCTVIAPATSCTITGLTNGTAYTFTTVATNSSGSSAPTSSVSATPATSPGAPTSPSATVENTSATVTFTAPASTGGAPITSYTVTAKDINGNVIGTCTATDPAVGCRVTGLTNGTNYQYSVVANNSVGSSAASALSVPVAPATVPGAPATVSATAPTYSTASVTVGAATVDGGSAITSYKITATPTGGGTPITLTVNAADISSAVTLTGLAAGTQYTISTVAINAVGQGSATTASSTITTPAAPPGAPAIASAASASTTTANISLSAPASNGGATITGYETTLTPVGGGSVVTSTSSTTSISATGLQPGTTYSVVATAVNSSGTGSASTSSSFTTPLGVSISTTSTTETLGEAITPITVAIAGSNPTNTTYSVTGALPAGLTLNTTTGEITGTPTVAIASTTFTITATSTVTGGATVTGTSTFTLGVNAVLPGAPASVSATSPTTTTAAVTIGASTFDGGATIDIYSISITPVSSGSIINTTVSAANIGSAVTVSNLVPGTEYTVSATAHNIVGNGPATTATSTIVTPVGVTPSTASMTGTVNTAITPITVSITALGATGTTYSISGTLPAGLTFDTSTGEISGTPTEVISPTQFVITAHTTLPSGTADTGSATVTIGVNATAPSAPTNVVGTVPSGGTTTANVSFTAPASTGGATVSYSISAVPVVSGSSVNTTSSTTSVEMTGLAPGTRYNAVVTATNSAGSGSATTATTFVTNPVMTTSVATLTGSVGTAITPITTSVQAESGSSITYSITGTLPAGLIFDAMSATISGTPTATTSAANFTITADVVIGGVLNTITKVVSIGVAAQAQAALNLSGSNSTVGSPVALTTSGGSGTGAITYAITGGTATGCAVSNTGSVTATGAGTCIVTATKAGDSTYGSTTSSAATITFAAAQSQNSNNSGGGGGGAAPVTPTPTPSPTATPSATPSPSATPTPSPSASPSSSPKPSPSASASASPKPNASPSSSPAPKPSASASASAKPSASASAKPSASASASNAPTPVASKAPVKIEPKTTDTSANVNVTNLQPGQKVKVTIVEKVQSAAPKPSAATSSSKKVNIAPKTSGSKANVKVTNLKPGQKVKVTIKEGK